MSAPTENLSIDQAFNKAYHLQQAGELQQAEHLYNQILNVQPQFHMAWFQLGLIAVDVGKMDIAAQMIAKASDCYPASHIYHRALTEIYRRLEKIDKALYHGRQATKHGEEDADSFYNYGLALADAKHFDDAVKAYQEAIKINAQYDKAYNNLGSAYENLEQDNKALGAYQKAIDLNPKNAEAMHNLGAMLLSQRNEKDKARDLFIKAIEINPNFIYAHHSLSSLKIYTTDDPHLQMLENIAPNADQLPHAMQVKFWFALGKARADIKNHKQAFEAYKTANTLHRQTFPYNIEDTRKVITALTTRFDQNFVEKESAGNTDKTPIFILGMPRSGSTLVEQILDCHSQIHGAGELKHLSNIISEFSGTSPDAIYIDWLQEASDDTLQDIGQRYIDRLRSHSNSAIKIVDKMPSNFFFVGLIHKILPNAKIIHSMRDPMDICVSNYTRQFKQILPFAYDLKELGHYCRLCDDMMAHWKNVLPGDFILSLQYEDLVENLEGKAKELIAFCGLDWEENCLNFHKNKRIVKTASYDQVNKPIYTTSVKRWKVYEDDLQPLIQSYGQVK